jgi:hypothetical protein
VGYSNCERYCPRCSGESREVLQRKIVEKPENTSTETAIVVSEAEGGDLSAEMLEEQIGSVSLPPSGTDNITEEFEIYSNEDRLRPKLNLDFLSYWKTPINTSKAIKAGADVSIHPIIIRYNGEEL